MPAPELRLLALGDSYTVGEGLPPAQAWPAQLAAALQAERGAPVHVQVLARTGWSAAELLAALDAGAWSPPYDLVTLQIGVNDQYRVHTLAQYEAALDGLLTRAIALAGGRAARVLALSIPDWGVTPFAEQDARTPAVIAAAVDACNQRLHQRAQRQHVVLCDVTALGRRAGCAPTMLVADGLHPSAAQYARWLEAILPAARVLLRGA